MEFTKDEISRFDRKYVEDKSGCWEWIGCKFNTGYGIFTAWRGRKGRRTFAAHRVSWMLHSGLDIPNKMVVRHTCDNRSCVNPSHLILGTYRENNLDTFAHGRANRALGENCSFAKLTRENVMEIHATNGYGSQKMLAEKFGVHRATISMAKSGQRWKHIWKEVQTIDFKTR